MESFSKFHSTHFADVEKRKYFAQQIRASQQQHQQQSQAQTERPEPTQEEADPWLQLPNESVEEWQLRHGLFHLTPDGVKMFDQSRQKREEVLAMLAAEKESLEKREITEEVTSPTNEGQEEESFRVPDREHLVASIQAFRQSSTRGSDSEAQAQTAPSEKPGPISELDILRQKAFAGMKRSRQSSIAESS